MENDDDNCLTAAAPLPSSPPSSSYIHVNLNEPPCSIIMLVSESLRIREMYKYQNHSFPAAVQKCDFFPEKCVVVTNRVCAILFFFPHLYPICRSGLNE